MSNTKILSLTKIIIVWVTIFDQLIIYSQTFFLGNYYNLILCYFSNNWEPTTSKFHHL